MTHTGMNGSLPVWAKFVSAVVVPSALAVYLVWFLANAVLGAITEHNDAHAQEMRILTAIMQQVCANTAETPVERSNCFPSP